MVFVLDLLYDNCEITTDLLLYSNDKNLEEIQQIVISTGAANLARQIIRATIDLALMAKKKQPERTIKLKPEKNHFNYVKKSHYAKDCCYPTSNKCKLKELIKEAKRSK